MDSKTFAGRLAKSLNIDSKAASAMIAAFAHVLQENATALNTIAIPGFGSFSGVKSPESVATDPNTGQKMLMPPRIDIIFSPSAMLKKQIENE